MAVVKLEKKPPLTDLTDDDIIVQLVLSHGVLKATADALKVPRGALSKRVNASKKLKEMCYEAKEVLIDSVEQNYFDQMLTEKDKVRQIFFLKCHGKDRGWVERQEVTGKDGENLGQVVAPVRAVNAEEWAKQNAAG